ncbi:response regulator receiver protein [Gordoniibacillus kamchatkensis]|uniref:Response regulator receiver protein n=1 Tax=Gordoniibacillus kamchatkensis TaxID=1590651 RepID=A0ABR5AKR0_9BACL|nr:response regulator [Paenibacillus sp. VKM B-2647]KIL40947.1 response regulator receiver protein [Paenibacillus sp. VKM B-2647]
MRLLIVDDEVIIRTGLCTVIDWKELGLDLLPPASSAEEVLERLAEDKPHIVLTDIRMPGMDGIELAKEIKKVLPDAEIVILTGYDDFAYAQQALREGVSDYLLKTSGPEEIIKAALQAKQHILAKWEAKKQESVQSAALLSQLLEEALDGQTEAAAQLAPLLDERFERSGAHPHALAQSALSGTVTVAIVTASGWGEGSLAGLLLGAVENMLSELLPSVTLMKKDRVIVVMRGTESAAAAERSGLERALQRVRETLKCELFAAVGSPATAYGQLHASYREAEEVFSYRSLLGEQGIYYREQIQHRQGGRTVCSHKEESELAAILMSNDPTQLRHWVNRLVRAEMESPAATPATLQAFMQSLVIAGHRWLERTKGDRSSEGAPPAVFVSGDGQRRRPEEEVFQLLSAVMAAFHETMADTRYSYVHKAIAYIRGRLDQAVTLQQVANFVHLNPNHFSEVFKKETGQSYIEFVTRERMQLAAQLLLSSRKKISEIAGEVGYGDMKYFSQQFKKYSGLTPSEFRQSPNG